MNTNEITNKKNKTLKFAILSITLIAIISLIGYAYARYITSLKGSSSADIAKWSFKVNGKTNENFTMVGYNFEGWSGKNLLNLSGRTVQNAGGYWSNTGKRKFSGNGIYLSISANNYYYGNNIEYEIDEINNNVTTKVPASRSGYGIDIIYNK